MIILHNPFILPLLLIVWTIDAYMWFIAARILLEKLCPDSQLTGTLRRLTEPLNVPGKFLAKRLRKELPQWISWLITFIALILIRHFLVLLIVSH